MLRLRERWVEKKIRAFVEPEPRVGGKGLVVPVDVANAAAHDERPYEVHVRRHAPVRPSDADLDEIDSILQLEQGDHDLCGCWLRRSA